MLLILGFDDPASVDAFRRDISLCRLVDMIVVALDAVLIERVEILLGVLTDWMAHWQHRAIGLAVRTMVGETFCDYVRSLSKNANVWDVAILSMV